MDKFFEKIWHKIKTDRKVQLIAIVLILVIIVVAYFVYESGTKSGRQVMYNVVTNNQPTVTYVDEPIELTVEYDGPLNSNSKTFFVALELGTENEVPCKLGYTFYNFSVNGAEFPFEEIGVESYISCPYIRTDDGFKYISLCVPPDGDSEIYLLYSDEYENASEKARENDDYSDLESYMERIMAASESIEFVSGTVTLDSVTVPYTMNDFSFSDRIASALYVRYDRNDSVHSSLSDTVLSPQKGDLVNIFIEGYYVVEYPCSQAEYDKISDWETWWD